VANRIRDSVKRVVDWPRIIDGARRHGVAPLLYRNLRSTSADLVPADAMQELEDQCLATAQANMVLAGALRRIVTAFEWHQVPAISFKGPLLAAQVYRDLGLRRFSDLDILVPPRFLERARDALASIGYRAVKEYRGWQTSFVDQQGMVCVDLHQRVSPPTFPVALDAERFLGRLRLVPLAGQDVATLSREDLLLVLCVQVARDAWANKNRLIKLTDVAEIVRELPAPSWPALLHEVRAAKADRMLGFSLRLSQELLGTDLPIGVLEGIDPRGSISALASRIAQDFLTPQATPARSNRVRSDHELRRKLCDGPLYRSQRARSVLSRWFTPNERDRAIVHVPRGVSFLYYTIRPVRLVHDVLVGRRSVDGQARERSMWSPQR
jgi:hypothetical protein